MNINFENLRKYINSFKDKVSDVFTSDISSLGDTEFEKVFKETLCIPAVGILPRKLVQDLMDCNIVSIFDKGIFDKGTRRNIDVFPYAEVLQQDLWPNIYLGSRMRLRVCSMYHDDVDRFIFQPNSPVTLLVREGFKLPNNVKLNIKGSRELAKRGLNLINSDVLSVIGNNERPDSSPYHSLSRYIYTVTFVNHNSLDLFITFEEWHEMIYGELEAVDYKLKDGMY